MDKKEKIPWGDMLGFGGTLLAIVLTVLVLALFSGCQTAHIKTAEWEATVNSHWFKRDVDRLTVRRTADGGYDIALNGYRGDTSEQLPVFTRTMFDGLVALGQLVPMAAKAGAVATSPVATSAVATSATLPVATSATLPVATSATLPGLKADYPYVGAAAECEDCSVPEAEASGK